MQIALKKNSHFVMLIKLLVDKKKLHGNDIQIVTLFPGINNSKYTKPRQRKFTT